MATSYESLKDTELINLFLQGDETGFETLYYRYRKNLYGFLNNMTRDANTADEVFEETWLKVIDNLQKYRDDGKFSAWLFRVARNIFYDKCRKKKTICEVEFDDVMLDETMTATLPEPDREMSAAELGKWIQTGLEELPDEQKEVFLLRQQDLSFKEISDLQKCSINTVLSRMQYALKSLKNFLNSIDNGDFLQR
jgi:RNA polymerase sigma-70 factor (ECF subfamily)